MGKKIVEEGDEMLDQMLGSIKAYFYKLWNVGVYDKELPEEVKVPSMYFPQPNILPTPHTKESYRNNYTMNVQMLAQDSKEAVEKAEMIAQSIRQNNFKIPILNEDGSETGGHLIFESVEVMKMEEMIAQVMLEWYYDFPYKN